MLLRRLAPPLVLAALLIGLPVTAYADDYSAPLETAVSDLPVQTEVRTGYDRSKFNHWVDADGDGCSTRNEVLLEEADDPPTRSARAR